MTGMTLLRFAGRSSSLPTRDRNSCARRYSLSPDTVLSDQPAEVSVAVANVRDAAGDYTATVSVDGVPEDSTTVALEPGARTRVRWSVSRADLASYQVEVAHLTAELVVRAPASYGGLGQMVAELVDDGAVTPAGTARLTATLGQSERWAERGIVARAIAHLERFQEIAADARFVPDAPARDTLTSEADQLIAQLSAER